MASKDNLLEAFAGESQANRKYLAFAARADRDGFPQVAKLFRAAAAAETVHANAHLRALGAVKSTAENLQAAVGGETFEYREMYPPYLKEAQASGEKMAEISFRNALAVEEVHAGMYSEALEAVKSGKDLPPRTVYVCDICGNTVYGRAPEKCPVCGAPASKFSVVE
jgi:rubrerythrin